MVEVIDGHQTFVIGTAAAPTLPFLPHQLDVRVASGLRLEAALYPSEVKLLARPVGGNPSMAIGVDLFLRDLGAAGELLEVRARVDLTVTPPTVRLAAAPSVIAVRGEEFMLPGVVVDRLLHMVAGLKTWTGILRWTESAS